MKKNGTVLFQEDSITDCGRRRDFEQFLYNTETGWWASMPVGRSTR